MYGSRSSQQNVKTNDQNTAQEAMLPHHSSEPHASQDSSRKEGADHSEPASELATELSKRELQIVELVSAGMTNQEISNELDISKRTVDNHVSNVLNKTATGNRVALVRWALQSGKVCIDELNCCHLPDA